MHQSKLQQEREKEAIRRRVSEDRQDRKVGAAAARLGTYEPDAATAAAAAAAAAAQMSPAAAALHAATSVRNATGAGASASGAGGVVSPPTDPHVTTSEVRVRCEDGTVLRRVFGADAPVAMVAQMVQEQRPAVAGPFVLRVPPPSLPVSPHLSPHLSLSLPTYPHGTRTHPPLPPPHPNPPSAPKPSPTQTHPPLPHRARGHPPPPHRRCRTPGASLGRSCHLG